MNPPPDPAADPRQIRSQIDHTRHRMDQTIDALGRRFEGRHLVDEALYFVRKQTENGKMTQLKQQFKQSADTAIHSVVDTIKANPVPAALIGAGIAWYLYSQQHAGAGDGPYTLEEEEHFTGDTDYNYSGATGDDVGPTDGETGGVGERVREKASELRARSRDALHTARARAGELGARARSRSQELARQGRQRISGAYERHPLEAGLITLALGLAAGLALPTPRRVRTAIAPRARQLRQRGEDTLERGRQVARSAMEAARQEAQAQGLTSGSPGDRTPRVQPAPSAPSSSAPIAQGATPSM